MAWISNGRIKTLMERAAGKPSVHIVYHAGAVDERAIIPFIGQISQARPPCYVALGEPQMIVTKTSPRSRIAKHNHTLARWFVISRSQCREYCGRAQAVRRRDVKGSDRVCALRGNGGAKDSVARDGVAPGAVVN